MSQVTEEIKNRLDLVDFVQSYVRLNKTGINWRGLCPFHNEKTPSFFVSPDKQIWHCFGCQKGGDVFTFLMEMEGIEFPDALRQLAERAGVKISREDPRARSERNRLLEAAEAATKFYEKNLWSPPASEILNYLRGRGLKDETIKSFRLGWAPDGWEETKKFILKQGFGEREAALAGLLLKSENYPERGYYDRFRDRIMFPIFDVAGKVVGFSGRIFDRPGKETAEGKYINTPETPIYFKRKILYGLDRAKVAIRRLNSVVMVEGNMDVIASHQAGVTNAVAVSGTALTVDQLQLLKRLADSVIFSFDRDAAGREATKRAIDLALEEGFNVKVADIGSGKDPADVVRDNPHLWEGMIKEARPVMDFYFRTAFEKHDKKSPEGKKNIARDLLSVIARVADRVEQAHYLEELAGKLRVETRVLSEILAKARGKKVRGTVPQEKKSEKSRREILEESVLACVIKLGTIKGRTNPEMVAGDIFEHHHLKKIYQAILENKKNTEIDSEKLAGEEASLLSRLVFIGDESYNRGTDMEKEFFQSIHYLKIDSLRKKLALLSQDIKEAEREKDNAALQIFTREFNNLSRELAVLEKKKEI